MEKTETKTSQHAKRYLVVGILVTVFNYGLYAIIANLIIRNDNYLWAATLISTFITTFVAYFSHSNITWKEREVTKTAIYKFFIWNLTFAFAVGPWLTQLFSLITPLYEFAYSITSAIHLPFDYQFVLTTGAFVLTSVIVMIINFLFYDKFVFGKKEHK